MNKNIKFLIIIFSGIILLAFLDIIVMEKIYHPLSLEYNIPWNSLYASENIEFIWWHIAFIPAGIILFILIGFAASSWKVSVSGILMFACGWEDIFYYVLRGSYLPSTLPWLNMNPFASIPRFITGAENVTSVGLTIMAILSLAFTLWLFFKRDISKWMKKL